MPTRARARRLLALPLATALSATAISTGGLVMGSTQSAANAELSRREHKIHHAVQIARRQIGEPYVYGANGPGAFDCSGLTSYAFHRAGLRMPRTSDAQYDRVRHIRKRNIRRGDLVFFHNGGGVYHVAIYLKRKHGDRIILHAPYPGRTVQRDPIWTRSWWAGTLRKRHR
ncbi:MAG TPA: C40 family peptidase [Nocardioidaceae bacterium]|nr:C40 family peptidase [Nocardioidaceae bacterium]